MKTSFPCMYLAGSTYHWCNYSCFNWHNKIWKHRSRVCICQTLPMWQALPTIGIIKCISSGTDDNSLFSFTVRNAKDPTDDFWTDAMSCTDANLTDFWKKGFSCAATRPVKPCRWHTYGNIKSRISYTNIKYKNSACTCTGLLGAKCYKLMIICTPTFISMYKQVDIIQDHFIHYIYTYGKQRIPLLCLVFGHLWFYQRDIGGRHDKSGNQVWHSL